MEKIKEEKEKTNTSSSKISNTKETKEKKTTSNKQKETTTTKKVSTTRKKDEAEKKTTKTTNKKQEQGKKRTSVNKKDVNEKVEKVAETKKAENAEEKNAVREEVNLEKIKQKIEENNKIPEEHNKTIKKLIFPNIFIALIITVFYIFLELGYTNIESVSYIIDLKVFSGMFLAIAIYLFEKAYNKDDSSVALYGIEMLMLSIINFSLVYIYYAWKAKFQLIVFAFAILVFVYYCIKSIAIYIKQKKQYVIEKY